MGCHMMKITYRLLSLLFALVLILGVSAQAAGTTPDPNPTREDLTLDEIQIRYDDHTHVAYADTHQWPASGTAYVEIAGVFTLSDLNGVTLPANLIIDVYQRYGGNNFRFVVRYDTTGGKPITVTDAKADAEAGDRVSGFDDVSHSDYFAQAVEWAAGEGVTQGTGNGAFSPKSTVTRAEAVTFLWRAAGSPAPTTSASSFTDVTDQNAYYYKAVLWAVEQDITQGVGGGRFNLTGTLAYDQIFTFLCRFAGEEASGDDWSAAAVTWARTSGLTDGLRFTAKGACPRSDVVYCLWKQLSDGEGQTQSEPEELPVLTDLQGAEAAIINSLLQLETQIDIKAYGLESSQAEALLADILKVDGYDNYYGVTSYWCTQLEGQTAWILQVRYETYDLQQMEQNRAVTAAVERVVAQTVTAGMSDYDIAKALHDYLVLNCEYDMRLYSGGMPSTAYTAYGALVDHTAVCAGYAKAYELLMEAAGIPCEYVSGYATGNHGWNVAEIDGEWYHVDTTWDDPIPDREGYVRYNYFLKSDSYMRQNKHTRWTADYTCTSTKYDNADLPDTDEQKKEQEEQEKEQERARRQAVLQVCVAAMEQFPLLSSAELKAAADEQLEAAQYCYIYFPEDEFDTDLLSQYWSEMKDELWSRNFNLIMEDYDQSQLYYKVFRNDVAQEIERRAKDQQEAQQQAQEEAAQAARRAEIRAYLENLLLTGEFEKQEITLPGYEVSELRAACKEMTTDGYQFGDYAYDSSAEYPDYRLTVYASGTIKVENVKWAEEEIGYFISLIQDAIRRGETRFTVPYREYENESNDIYATRAVNRMSENYSFDGYTAGVDYVITAQGGSPDAGTHTVAVEYPAKPQPQPEQTQDSQQVQDSQQTQESQQAQEQAA